MPFIPLSNSRDSIAANFPRVSSNEQAARDIRAENLVASEFDQSMPDVSRAALESEYRQRFAKEPPAVGSGQSEKDQRGFVPLSASGAVVSSDRRGFIPLASGVDSERLNGRFAETMAPAFKTMKAIGQVYPVAETAANLITQGAALPIAGVAGLGAVASNALGLTDTNPADVVHSISNALTYQPVSEHGKHLTQAVMTPFEWLAEAGSYAGTKTLEATGSPVAATAVDTAINAIPMAVAPAFKATRRLGERFGAERIEPEITDVPDLTPSTVAMHELESTPKGRQENGVVPLFPEMEHGTAVGQGRGNAYDVPGGGVPTRSVERASETPVAERRDASIRNIDDNSFGEGIAREPRTERLAGNDSSLFGTELDRLAALWGGGNIGVPGMGERLREFPARHGDRSNISPLAAPERRSGQLRADELRVGNTHETSPATLDLSENAIRGGDADLGGNSPMLADRSTAFASTGDETANINSGISNARALGAAERMLADLQREGLDGQPVGAVHKGSANLDAEAPVHRMASRIDSQSGALFVTEDGSQRPPARDNSLKAGIDRSAHEAATSPRNDLPEPTQAQKDAGNYPKGHLRIAGLDISIENPRGSIRSGVSPEGKSWKSTLKDHYGYIRRTRGNDGQQVDVFIGGKPESGKVFVIDQINPKNGRFDEHKAVLGAESINEAKAIYERNYESGWKGGAAIKEMTLPDFKEWVRNGDTHKPLAIRSVLGKPVTEVSDSMLKKMVAKDGLLSVGGKSRPIVLAEATRRDLLASDPVTSDTNQAAKIASEVRRYREKMESQATNDVTRNSFAPGANYAPLVDDSRAAAGTQSVADLPVPIRREGIIKDLTKALDTTVYEGRVKGKNRLGFFRPKLEEVRTKRANDLEVAAHELAHLVDDRIPEIRRAWQNDKALAAELKSISYDQTKVYEGFAEGVRLWMTQPETLQAKAPKVAAWLDDFAGQHPYGPALKKAQADMSAWFGQDALNRARSKIGVDNRLSEHFDRAFDKFRQSTVDDLHGIYQMERSLSGGKIAPVGAYETARLSRASASIADGAVRFGHPVKKADGSFAYAGKGLMEALKPVAEGMDDALLYFVGRSARELMQQGREHLFTQGEIQGMLKLRTPERDAAFKDYQAWNKGVLDFAEAQGVINPEARALWQRTQYLPFHRVTQPGTLKGKPGDWAGIKALTGGTENIKDVLGNMVANAAMLIDTAVKNEARLKVAELASQPGAGKFMVKIDPESRPVKVSGSQVMDAMFEKYGIAVDGQVPAFFEFFLQGQPPAGGNVVAVLKGGKPTYYEVGDPILYRALTSIDRPPMHWITKWLGMPKRLGQMAITLTPDFMLANIARDTIMGGVMSRSGFRPVLDSLKGMRLRMTNDPLYKDYIANGGGLSSLFLDENHLRTKLEKFYNRQGIDYRTVLDTPDKMLSFVETLGDAFEMSTRLGEYGRAIAKGEHPRHAAYQGREVSTDFAMKGDSKALGFMMDVTMFLRPAIVSMDRLFRGVAHDPNKAAIGAKTAMIALSSVGLYLLNRDDPRYADLPDWDRDSNWHFFIGDQHFRYPKIWEIGAVASLAERTVEKLVENNPQGLGKDFARIIANTFNLNFKPQIMAPLYEQATNRNSFTGSPIETPSMENVQPFMRAKPNTSETMKALGMATRDLPEALQVNPVRTEALLRGYLNTWASYGLMMTDKAFFDDKSPAMRTDQMPVVRRFYSQEPPQHTKFETEFYDMLGEAKRLHGTLRQLDGMGRQDIADAKEKEALSTESKPLERAAKNLGGINKDMLAVRRNAELNPTEKRQKLDGLTVERNALLKAAVQDSKKAQQEKRE